MPNGNWQAALTMLVPTLQEGLAWLRAERRDRDPAELAKQIEDGFVDLSQSVSELGQELAAARASQVDLSQSVSELGQELAAARASQDRIVELQRQVIELQEALAEARKPVATGRPPR